MEAVIENVSATTRSTSLSRGNVKIQTVEHVLAAFAGRGIDNAMVELDANEPPIGDGSARAVHEDDPGGGGGAAGRAAGGFPRAKPDLPGAGRDDAFGFSARRASRSPARARTRGGATRSSTRVEVTPETWERELGHARTFCFFEEIEALIKNGLIKGGSLENAVVIRDDAVLTTEPLRYPEEFVRHKILDIDRGSFAGGRAAGVPCHRRQAGARGELRIGAADRAWKCASRWRRPGVSRRRRPARRPGRSARWN